jgi:hypothetical protein
LKTSVVIIDTRSSEEMQSSTAGPAHYAILL